MSFFFAFQFFNIGFLHSKKFKKLLFLERVERPKAHINGAMTLLADAACHPQLRDTCVPPPQVLLHVKHTEEHAFLFETTAQTEVEVALTEITKIVGLRQKLARLADASEGLAQHGPMKPPEQQGLDDDTPLLEDYDVKSGEVAPRTAPERGANYREDPTQRRTGNAPPEDIAAMLLKTVEDGRALISHRQVPRPFQEHCHESALCFWPLV